MADAFIDLLNQCGADFGELIRVSALTEDIGDCKAGEPCWIASNATRDHYEYGQTPEIAVQRLLE